MLTFKFFWESRHRLVFPTGYCLPGCDSRHLAPQRWLPRAVMGRDIFSDRFLSTEHNRRRVETAPRLPSVTITLTFITVCTTSIASLGRFLRGGYGRGLFGRFILCNLLATLGVDVVLFATFWMLSRPLLLFTISFRDLC